MSKKPTVLMILDGFGLNEKHQANAVYEAKTPVLDDLMANCPFVKGYASGMAVGLPDGQMGNSEVGHLNMGAGRIVYQELTRITKEIQDGDFFKNEALLKAVKNAKENNSALHLFGLLSDGGVHSHNTHLYALLELAKREGLENVYVHCFLDGRDTPPASGKDFVKALYDEMATGVGKVASVMGRYYAIDEITVGTVLKKLTTLWLKARASCQTAASKPLKPYADDRQMNLLFLQLFVRTDSRLQQLKIKTPLSSLTSDLTVQEKSQELSVPMILTALKEKNVLI